jgi:hypothetical protein
MSQFFIDEFSDSIDGSFHSMRTYSRALKGAVEFC